MTDTMKSPDPWSWSVIAVFAIVASALGFILNVWIDESFSLLTSSRGLAYAVERSLFFELQPPLYFVVLTAWRAINGSILFARILSVIFAVVTLVVVRHIWRRSGRSASAAFVLAPLAAHLLVVHAATDIRVYALALLLSALSCWLFLEGYVWDGPRKFANWHTVVAIAGIYTQYYLGFLLLAQGVTLALMRRARATRAYLLRMSFVAITISPYVLLLGYQLASARQRSDEALSLFTAVRWSYHRVLECLLPTEGNVLGEVQKWILLALVLGCLVAWRRRRAKVVARNALVLVSIFAIMIVAFSAALWIAGPRSLSMRHTISLLVPAMVGFTMLADEVGGRWMLSATAAACAVFGCVASANRYGALAKPGDWKKVAGYLEQHELPGDAIVLFRSQVELPLGQYYGGPSTIITVPRPMRTEVWDLEEMVIESERQVVAAVARSGRRPDRLWLVADDVLEFRGVDFHREFLERWVARCTDVVSSESFYRSTVRLLRPRASPECGWPSHGQLPQPQ